MTPEEVDRAVALAKNRLRLNPDLRDSLHTLIDRALLTEHSRANDSDASFDLRWKADMPAEPPATDDLVQRLRDYSPFERQHVVHEAADTIERQARKIARLDRENQAALECVEQANAAVERAEAERDALREQLHLRTCERDEAQACITTSADTIAALRECVKAADAMYALTEHTGGVSDCAKCNVADDYLAARAKVKP